MQQGRLLFRENFCQNKTANIAAQHEIIHLMQNLIQKQKTMVKSQDKVGAESDDWIPIQNRIQNLDPRIRSHIQSVNWKLSKEQVWSRKT